ncbi:MAG: hypothetical protein ACRCX2_01615 [Paraclostridium sp.]
MGLVITVKDVEKSPSFRMGYGGFMMFRRAIVEAFDKNYGTDYNEKYFATCIGTGKMGKTIEQWKVLSCFLFHCDCDGYMSPKECDETLLGLLPIYDLIDEEYKEDMKNLRDVFMKCIELDKEAEFC